VKRFLAAVVIAASTILPAHAEYTCTREYGSTVNLRNGPSRNASVIASIPAYESLWVYTWVYGGDNMRWVKANVGGLVGWIRSDYVCR
jgi:uncharacterized protein YraI